MVAAAAAGTTARTFPRVDIVLRAPCPELPQVTRVAREMHARVPPGGPAFEWLAFPRRGVHG